LAATVTSAKIVEVSPTAKVGPLPAANDELSVQAPPSTVTRETPDTTFDPWPTVILAGVLPGDAPTIPPVSHSSSGALDATAGFAGSTRISVPGSTRLVVPSACSSVSRKQTLVSTSA
jgi:hypothetical protein